MAVSASAKAKAPSSAPATGPLALLVCPTCRAELTENEGAATCPGGHSFTIDRAGVVLLTEDPFYYREVPQEFFQGVMKASDREGVESAFEEALADLPPSRRDYIRNYALDPRRGAVAVLGQVGPGTVALDFGCGWGNLTRTVEKMGGTVLGVDMTYESLFFSQMINDSPRQWGVRAGAQYPLPFRDGAFDTVFLNGVLEWLPEGFMLDKDPREVQRMFLTEFRRILRPGGRLVVAIENRNSYAYWKGWPEDHTNLRFNALLPRAVSNLNSKKKRGRPYRTYTYTNRGYRSLLRDSGFASADVHVPWPRYRNFDQILIGRAIRDTVVDAPRAGDGPRAFVGKRLLKGLQKVGFLEAFAQDFHLVAYKDPGPTGGSLYGTIALRHGDDPEGVRRITVSSTCSAHFTGSRWFYKLPLTAPAQRRLRSEVEQVAAAQQSPLAPWVVPEASLEEIDGLVYGRFTRVHGTPATDMAQVVPFLDAALTTVTTRALGTTDAWVRIRSLVRRMDEVGVTTGADAGLKPLEKRRLAVGHVHGDLCRQNLLASEAGVTIVDWDRAEAQAPLFLDPMHLLVDAGRRDGGTLASALDAALDDTGPSATAARARGLVDELSMDEARLLYLLSRMERDSDSGGGIDKMPRSWQEAHLPILADNLRRLGISTPSAMADPHAA